VKLVRAALALSLGAALCGCPAPSKTTPTPAPSAPARAVSPAEKAALQETAKELGKRLKGRLKEALGKEGFEGGIRVCSAEAQTLTAAVAAERKAKLGRTSSRLRNPNNAPPEWAQAWVESEGEEPHFARGEGTVRALLPIRTAPLCVSCHGPQETLTAPVKAALAKHYPQDAATGFQAGELRGWFWVELPATE
jgi:uncharacterized protein DUF3365